MRLKWSIFTGLALLALLAGSAFLGGRWAYTNGIQAEAQGPQGFEAARSDLEWAYRLRNRHAAFELGRLYRDGDLTSRDFKTAFAWFEKGAKRGDTDALTAMALAHWKGQGVETDPSKGTQLLHQAASLGNARAMGLLAQDLINGHYGGTYDLPQALQWAEKGAALDDATSMYITGLSYLTASKQLGREANFQLGCTWIEKAAEAGNRVAMFLSGIQNLRLNLVPSPRLNEHEIGPGDEQNLKTTFGIVDNGVSKALSDTGSLPLFNFNGVLHPADGAKAERFLRQASEKGIRQADRYLVLMVYAHGCGDFPANTERALEVLHRMSDYGDDFAPTYLGRAYVLGDLGLKQDLKTAEPYLRLGADRGNELAKTMLATIQEEVRHAIPMRDEQRASPVKVEQLGVSFNYYPSPHLQGIVKNIGTRPLSMVEVTVQAMEGSMVLETFKPRVYRLLPGQQALLDVAIDPSLVTRTRMVIRDIDWR